MEKEKVLITGGAGYIGSVLTPILLDKAYIVTVLDNLMYNQTSLIHHCSNPNFKFIKADVTDYSFMKKELQNHDIIIPLAAIVGAPACKSKPLFAKSINLEAINFISDNTNENQKILF
nr:UDP-glucose 4-epimerase [Candidatus Anoxychlamydiales bacterium]